MKGHDVSRPQEIKNNNIEEGHNSLYPIPLRGFV